MTSLYRFDSTPIFKGGSSYVEFVMLNSHAQIRVFMLFVRKERRSSDDFA